MLDAVQGDARRAARLLGAIAALREDLEFPRLPSILADYERAVAAVKDALGDAAYVSAWEAGRILSLDDAVAEALAEEIARTGEAVG